MDEKNFSHSNNIFIKLRCVSWPKSCQFVLEVNGSPCYDNPHNPYVSLLILFLIEQFEINITFFFEHNFPTKDDHG